MKRSINNTNQLKNKLYTIINQLSKKYNKKITRKMGMYRRYWDGIIGTECSESLDRKLIKEIEKIKKLSRKQFGMCFGKKPLDQCHKGVGYLNKRKFKTYEVNKKVLGV
jgi:hypothetical protein